MNMNDYKFIIDVFYNEEKTLGQLDSDSWNLLKYRLRQEEVSDKIINSCRKYWKKLVNKND